jgi:predicted RNase H-like nuclease
VSELRVAGVDVWKGQWLAVVLRGRSYESAHVASEIANLLGEIGELAAVGIDMPIGLANGRERREADVAARAFVGWPRGSSVFPTYPREVYSASTIEGAREVSLRLLGISISAQAYRLGERLLELERVAAGRDQIREVHPEVSFCAMASHQLAWPKTSWNGFHERVELLEAERIELPSAIADIGSAGTEDVLDAAAAAWSARRIAEGVAASLPTEPRQFVDGRALAIWY